MYRRQPVFQALEPQVVSSGLLPDRHVLQRPLWERASNVRFYSGKVRRLVPAATMFSFGAGGGSVRGLAQAQASNGVRWVYAAGFQADGSMPIYRWYGPAAQQIGIYTTGAALPRDATLTAQAAYIDLLPYGDWLIINDSIHQPALFKPENIVGGVGTTGTADYTNAPIAQTFMKRGPQVLAIGTAPDRKGFAWSDSISISTWLAAPTNLAGKQQLMELTTGLNAAAPLGSLIAAYSEDQMVLIQFVGLPNVFNGSLALDGIGAIGKMAVASDGRTNYGVSRNGVWRTDGQSYQYIDDPAIHDYFQENVNWTQGSKIIAARNDVTGCFDFHFPMRGATEVNEGWSYDPRTSGWGMIPPHQIQVERSLFANALAGDAGTIYLMDSSTSLPAALDLATRPLVTSGLHSGALIDEADVLLQKATNVEFRVGVSEYTDPTSFYDWSNWHSLNTDTRTYRLDLRVSATYAKVEFRSTDPVNWDLDLQGFVLYGNAEGARRDRA